MQTVAIAHADQVGGGMDILEEWANELKKYADGMGYTVIDICGSDLTYECMTKILGVTKPAVLFYFGFGDKAHLMGNDMRPALTNRFQSLSFSYTNGMLSNLDVIKGTAVIAYASHAASQLGPEITMAGSPCFVGFSDSLIVVSDKDNTLNIFKESLLPLAKRILYGWTVGKAVEATRIDLLNKIKEYKVKGSDLISIPMFYNRRSLTLLGDPNWKLKGYKFF